SRAERARTGRCGARDKSEARRQASAVRGVQQYRRVADKEEELLRSDRTLEAGRRRGSPRQRNAVQSRVPLLPGEGLHVRRLDIVDGTPPTPIPRRRLF